MKEKKNKRIIFFLFCLISSIVIILIGAFAIFELEKNKPYYEAKDFGIQIIYSPKDKNENGIDDYTDILIGAKKEAENKPIYRSAYYQGGYPPDTEGVCTDVVWRALKNAGYCLKDMIDEDIKKHTELYQAVEKPDPNIDFRRVRNLKVYFDRYEQILTTDLTKIEEWQPGDIVIIGTDTSHIGIISDKRNKKGIPYLIHNYGQPYREEDILERLDISNHYRFTNEA